MRWVTTDDIQAAVDRLAEQLHRSVVIDDPAVRMLYNSAHFGDEDPVRVEAILRRKASAQAIGHVLAQGVSSWSTPGVIPANDEIGMQARVCVPIRWRGELLGLLIVMDAESTVTTSELASIDSVAREVAPMLAVERGHEERDSVEEQTVLDLVSPEPALRRRALADLATHHDLERNATVAAVEIGVRTDQEAGALSHVQTALRSAVRVAFPRDAATELCAVSERHAVLLLGSPGPLPRDVVRRHARRMTKLANELAARRFSCIAGIGASVAGLDRAADSARQASLARQAAAQLLGTEVTCWEELGPYGPLLLIPPPDLNPAFLPAELQRLLEVDRDQHLIKTLRAYFDNACSGPAASEALNIHRTTLYYRLGRIADLTGLDLADGRTRLVLHMGLAFLDLIRPDFRQ
jgi:sugar diacid utilization regulator